MAKYISNEQESPEDPKYFASRLVEEPKEEVVEDVKPPEDVPRYVATENIQEEIPRS